MIPKCRTARTNLTRFETNMVKTDHWSARFQTKTSQKNSCLQRRSYLYSCYYTADTYVAVTITIIATRVRNKNYFERKRLQHLSKGLESVGNIAKEAIKARISYVRITWISNYKKFKFGTPKWTPTWSRTDYVINRRAENQSRSRGLLSIR